MRSATRFLAVFILAFCLQPGLARAEYPDKPIRIVVTFLAGGSADVLARIIAPKLESAWKQPVIVENRAGAGGNMGAEVVARVVGVMPNILLVAPHVPAKNIKELIAYAKANPGKLTYGSQGVGSTPHLTGVMLAKAAGIDIVHVPYRGFPPVLQDLLGSRLDFAFADASNSLPQVRGGTLRAMAVASAKRFSALPDTPTLIESGFPDFESATWMSVSAPAGTPGAVIKKWQEELAKIAQMPDVKARFAELGVESWASTPDEMKRHMQSEIKRWGDVIQGAGIKAQ
jgi:tripartite-type tricarboxylate transporter receptor subunit TctC